MRRHLSPLLLLLGCHSAAAPAAEAPSPATEAPPDKLEVAPAVPETPTSAPANPVEDAPPQPLGVGAAAPEVVGTDGEGQTVKLSELGGHPAVVYFYPKDATPGCTTEACAFRDAFERFAQANVTIFGVSRDDESSHAAFRKEHGLQFPLVADVDGKVQKAYGVPGMGDMAARWSFLVDGEGKIAHIWKRVDPAVHASEVLALAKALSAPGP